MFLWVNDECWGMIYEFGLCKKIKEWHLNQLLGCIRKLGGVTTI